MSAERVEDVQKEGEEGLLADDVLGTRVFLEEEALTLPDGNA